ncbi:MAG: molybdenum cofactor biosynthesis protein MoaE [Vulcanimicrobiaceae bacterium]
MAAKLIQLLDRPIDIQEVYREVCAASFGAVVVFTGVVRDESDDRRGVSGLEYEAYRELALAEMERIAGEARSRWAPCRVAMQHRTGILSVGEPSVVVAVATAHRPEAFAACRYAIDELKACVPIWKKELFTSGGAAWRENVQ